MNKDYYSIFDPDRETSKRERAEEGAVVAQVAPSQRRHQVDHRASDTYSSFQKLLDSFPSISQLEANSSGQWIVTEKKTPPPLSLTAPRPRSASFPASTAIQEEPPPLSTLQSSSQRINELFAEVIEELETRIHECEKLERFPQLEEYMEKHSWRVDDTLLCQLCRADLQHDPRWHFECVHYDEFLSWLETRARGEAKRRRSRLIRHRKALKDRRSLKN